MQQSNQQLDKDAELNPLLQNPSELDPQLVQRNLKLPLEMCQQGRALLKEKKYLQASKSFSKSVMSFQYLLKNNLLTQQQTKQIFTQIMIPTYSNLSLCYLKIEQYQSVIAFCNQILNHDNSHVKSRYRRGLAQQKLKKYDQAIQDFALASQLDPSLKDECQGLIKQCKAGIIKQKQKEKKIAAAFVEELKDPRSEKSQSTQKRDLIEQEMKQQKTGGKISKMSFVQKIIDGAISCCKKLSGRR